MKIIAIVPVYNNEKTIAECIQKIKVHCNDIIVVNDGSTDLTGNILQHIDITEIISFPYNKGKGEALKAGFERASVLGFTHAITVDADGQHSPDDIQLFIERIKENPHAIWIGNRILQHKMNKKVPLRSRFGRKFGNFWYKFNTGIKLNDTQCGFRVYPLQEILKIKSKGRRYEYEQDLLLKAAWNGIIVKEIDVHILYQSKDEAVSHFRPVRDFLLISKINSSAAMMRIFFPFLLKNSEGSTWKERLVAFIKHELKANTTPRRAAASVGAGVFIGIFPIHGIQIISIIGIAHFVRLNKPLALLGLCVSSPPMIPLLLLSTIATGKLILPDNSTAFIIAQTITQNIIEFCVGGLTHYFPVTIHLFKNFSRLIVEYGVEFIVGSIVLSFPAGILSYLFTLPIFKQYAKFKYDNPRVLDF